MNIKIYLSVFFLTAFLAYLNPLFSGSKSDKSDLSIFGAKVYESGDHSLKYRWAVPAEIKKGEKYPLVIVLHGLGERGDDNTKQLIMGAPLATDYSRKNFPCFIILPQANKDSVFPSFGIWGNPKDKKLSAEPTIPTKLTLELIEKTISENPAIDKDRIYIVGQSMGGSGVFEFLGRRPDIFAAAVPVYLGGTPDTCKIIAKNKIPIRFMNDDQNIPFSYELLKQLGADVDYIAKFKGN